MAGFDVGQQSTTSEWFSAEPTRFRTSPMAIVPYIEIPLPDGAIRSIRVGPGNNIEVREAGVRRLLKSVGSEAEVLRSEVPLRS